MEGASHAGFRFSGCCKGPTKRLVSDSLPTRVPACPLLDLQHWAVSLERTSKLQLLKGTNPVLGFNLPPLNFFQAPLSRFFERLMADSSSLLFHMADTSVLKCPMWQTRQSRIGSPSLCHDFRGQTSLCEEFFAGKEHEGSPRRPLLAKGQVWVWSWLVR